MNWENNVNIHFRKDGVIWLVASNKWPNKNVAVWLKNTFQMIFIMKRVCCKFRCSFSGPVAQWTLKDHALNDLPLEG